MTPVEQIAADVHVRKETDVLRHVADAAVLRRQVARRARVEQEPVADRDRPARRNAQPRNRVQNRRLARAGGTEDRRDLRVDPLVDLEREFTLRELKRQDHHAREPPASRLAPQSAANARPVEIASSATAARSCPVSAYE